MAANLAIVMKNPEPNRQNSYPRTWFLYTPERKPLKLTLTRNIKSQPRVKASSEDTAA
jgi:hypothetical protein